MIRVNLIRLFFLTVTLLYFPLLSAQDEKAPETESVTEQQAPAEEKNTEASEDDSSSGIVTFDRSKLKIAPPVAIDKQQSEDIEHYLPSDEIQQLSAGEDEFISLKQMSNTRNSKGVVVFLPDWQQTPVNPKAINFLRKTLPEKGWVTIAIQAPLKPKDYPSLIEDKKERREANQKTLQTYQENLTNKLKALMDKTRDYPGIILFVTQGNNAGVLFDLYQQQKVTPPTALIMLSAYMLTDEANELFAENMAKSSFPVFDVTLTKDHHLVANSANLRKIAAEKEMKIFYRQRKISNLIPTYYPEKTLLKEIEGWLKSVGW